MDDSHSCCRYDNIGDSMEYNYQAIEDRWQKLWDEKKIYEPVMGGTKFLITVPYPYCNGALHIGHGRTYTIADIFARFKRMNGYNVLFPMAFHISGTPILAFSKKIERGDKTTIDLYKSYMELYGDDPEKVYEFSKPENIANYFANKIILDFKNLGLSIDWTRQFNSGEKIYNKFVEWQFRKLMARGYLKQGDYPLLYSPSDGNPVGEDDIQEGDTDKVSITEFVSVFFEMGEYNLLASTLRPETLEGVTNLFVNPGSSYSIFLLNGMKFIASNEGFNKLRYQLKVEKIGEIKGNEMVGKVVKEPLHGRSIPIIEGKFVDPDNASGIVYSVPYHSIWDYVALKESGAIIEPIKVIEMDEEENMEDIMKKFNISSLSDKEKLEEATKFLYEKEFYHGKIIRGDYEGKFIKEIKDKIVEDFISKGIAIKFYETSRKAYTREGDRVIVAIINGQWFIDYSKQEWKEKVKGLIDRMELKPDPLKSQFLQMVDWIRERPCARRRGLGTRLPMDPEWIIESLSDSTIYTSLYPVIRYLREIGYENLDDSIFDFIFLGENVLENKDERIKEIARNARKEFEFWYPVDLRHTSYPHISNHLTFYLFQHVAIFPENDWPVGISTGGIVISEGQKMAKSKGNVIPLLTVKRKYGADLFRLYLASNADVWYDVDWRSNEAENYTRKMERFFELASEASKVVDEPDERDLWLIARFNRRLAKAKQSFESMKIRDASIELFFNMLNDVRDLENFAGKERMLRVVRKFADKWALSLSPIIPYISEEIHSIYGGSEFASLQNYPVPDNSYENYEKEWQFIESVIEDYRNILKISQEKHSKLIINTAEDWKWELLERYRNEGKHIMKDIDGEKRDFVLQLIKKGDIKADIRNEADVLEKYKDDLKKFLNIDIEINGEIPPGRLKKAYPGKPSLTLS